MYFFQSLNESYNFPHLLNSQWRLKQAQVSSDRPNPLMTTFIGVGARRNKEQHIGTPAWAIGTTDFPKTWWGSGSHSQSWSVTGLWRKFVGFTVVWYPWNSTARKSEHSTLNRALGIFWVGRCWCLCGCVCPTLGKRRGEQGGPSTTLGGPTKSDLDTLKWLDTLKVLPCFKAMLWFVLLYARASEWWASVLGVSRGRWRRVLSPTACQCQICAAFEGSRKAEFRGKRCGLAAATGFC